MKIQECYTFQKLNTKNSNFQNTGIKNFLSNDIITFTSLKTCKSVESRMSEYAIKILKKHSLKNNQPLYIKGSSYYLPFMEALSKEAYKMKSGPVFIDVIEQQLEKLKEKFNITGQFDYQKERLLEFQNANALFLEFDKENNPYKEAKITKKEVLGEIEKNATTIPQNIRKLFKFNPKEILIDALDMKKGQPAVIFAEREHLPFIKNLVNFLFSKNKSTLVDINITNNNDKFEIMYGADKIFEKLSKYKISQIKEYYEKDVAWIRLFGKNPTMYEDVPAEKLARSQKLNSSSEVKNEYMARITSDVPWLVYNLPTVLSSINSYPELAENKIQLIAKAYEDASKINRSGQLKEHIESLKSRAQKMNELIQRGYRTFHYVSVDDQTKQPDGKTDFKIKLSPKSMFKTSSMEMTKYGHSPIVNIPTEEVFTAPQANTANGTLYASMPLSLNGKIVDGIKMRFKDGRVVDVQARENQDIIKDFINNNENADCLGELAIVVDSPIAQTGRVFNSTLLDENAACHFALGSAYPDTIEGSEKFEDYSELQNYLKSNNINTSSVHVDFMVGGKNVYITAINEKTGDTIEILKDNNFLL
jgi:aminopeptidase